MPYKLMKIASYYRKFLDSYYEKFPDITQQSYSRQLKHLLEQHFAWSDYYAKELNKLGYNAVEIIANAEPLQKQWAKENNQPYDFLQTIENQIKTFKPEILWFQDSISFNGDFVKKIREKFDFIKLVIGNICSPFKSSFLNNLKTFDFITTCSPYFEQIFRRNNLKTLLLYHAFSPEILEKISAENKNIDLIFIGNIILKDNWHDKRREFLEKILSYGFDLHFYGEIQARDFIQTKKEQLAYLALKVAKRLSLKVLLNHPRMKKIAVLEKFPRKEKIPEKLNKIRKPPVYGIEMFEKLSKAKICFNIHGDTVGNYAANMRLFEATGVGTCLLTDNKQNISELFEPENEIVTYNNGEELTEKLRWLSDNPQKLEQIAKNGQKRTLRQHTYKHRAEQLDEFLRKLL